MPNKKNNRASRYAAPIGGIFIILCFFGFFSLISSSFRFTQSLLDNTDAKHAYEQQLLPVLMFDPPPFEDPATMRQIDLLMYSVWAAVLGDKRDIYEYDDNMSLIIPASDVDLAAYKLFGAGVTLSHDTFGDYDITYVYDIATKSYHVPVGALTGFYTPRVEEIVKKGDVIQLKVGYIPPANALNIDLSGKGNKERTADKYMTYELRKNKKEYFLYAMRDVEGATLPGGIVPVPDMLPGLGGGVGIEGDLEFLPQPESTPAPGTSDIAPGVSDTAPGASDIAPGISDTVPAGEVQG